MQCERSERALQSEVISVNMLSMQREATAEPRPRQRAYHHGHLRPELLRLAREAVREAGPEHCSMREVSRRAGVSQAAPYRHFEDKEALLDAVGANAYGELEQHYHRALGAISEPADAARAVAGAYLDFALQEQHLFRLIFSSARLHATPEAKRSYNVFEQAIVQSQDCGVLPAGPPRDLAHVLWAVVHGVADLVHSGSFSDRHGRRVAERALDTLMQGWLQH
jgi:AcrR family transcriptional regulator